MVTPARRPFPEVVFDRNGDRKNGGPLVEPGVTDLIVISHGWHQDGNDARDMYEAMVAELEAEARATGRLGTARLGVLGVHWPSDKYRDDLALELISNVSQGQERVAASSGQGGEAAAVNTRARQLEEVFGLERNVLVRAVQRAAGGGSGDQDALLALLRRAVGDGEPDEELAAEHAELLNPARSGSEVLQALTIDGLEAAPAATAGQGAALGVLSGVTGAVARVLNQFAYYELKKRAATVGAKLGRLLDADPAVRGVRLHMVGHSFGARLVTAAVSNMIAVRPRSLVLLQGAFSHNALGLGDARTKVPVGAFRNVVADRKVDRIVISHTWNDRAVGLAYAAASRVSNTTASALVKVSDTFGGGKDRYGGIGANGALLLANGEGERMDFDGRAVPGLGAYVNSFRSDFITHHSDVRGRGVARLVLAAMD